MTTPVNFELAKLLKEKGFDKPCIACYDKCDMLSSYVENVFEPKNYNTSSFVKSAPTIAEVVMWLYEKHGIWISIDMVYEEDQTGFWYCIRESKIDDIAVQSEEYNSPTEAYEAAIEYTLKNLTP